MGKMNNRTPRVLGAKNIFSFKMLLQTAGSYGALLKKHNQPRRGILFVVVKITVPLMRD